MHSFDPENPVMAEGYEDYGPLITALVQRAGVTGEAHMTVDEKIVQPGMSQRRPGAHLDGRFLGDELRWDPWAYSNRMALVVASSVAGCKVYEGDFDAEPAEGGDLEHIREQLPEGELLPANRGFLLSPDCIHESLIFNEPTKRTFLRIVYSPAA